MLPFMSKDMFLLLDKNPNKKMFLLKESTAKDSEPLKYIIFNYLGILLFYVFHLTLRI